MASAKDELTLLMKTAEELRSMIGDVPKTVVVLGSGFASVADQMHVEQAISFSQIEAFPVSTVSGHSGKVLVGTFAGHPLLLCVGRIHYYEGWSAQEIVRPVRAFALAGAEEFLLTNAAGGLHGRYSPGDFLALTDHINAMGFSPLRGANLDELGPRFPDMTQVYDPTLRSRLLAAANAVGAKMHQGVYLAVTGPQYETPAEIESYRRAGADCVGMSTVPEAISLRHMGRKVVGMSLITNLAAGLEAELSHADVLARGKQAASQFSKILEHYLSAN